MNRPEPPAFPSRPLSSEPSAAEDADWIQATLSGETEAFGRIYEKYRERVYRILYRVVWNRDDALEATQEVFLKAHHALARFDPTQGQLGSWLARISTNLGIDLLRRRGTRRERSYDPEYMLPSDDGPARSRPPEAHQKVEEEEVATRIDEALATLSSNHQEVFLLYSYEGHTYEEIGEILDIPIGTVMSRLYYARKHIRELLPPDWDPGGPRRRVDRRNEDD